MGSVRNENDREPKNTLNAAHKDGFFLDGEDRAHNGRVESDGTALLSYLFQAGRSHHVETGLPECRVSGSYQVTQPDSQYFAA